MQVQTIKENIERLAAFKLIDLKPLGVDEKFATVATPEGLLKWYGRMLDYVGAPIRNLSTVYVHGSEFEEMEEFAKGMDGYDKRPALMSYDSNTGKYSEIPGEVSKTLMFNYLGYEWVVERKN